MGKILRNIFSFEIMFLLFLVAGGYKASVTFIPDWLDITVLFMVISMVITGFQVLRSPVLPKAALAPIAIMLTFTAVLMISYIFSDSTSYAWIKLSRFVVITLWSFLGVLLMVRRDQQIKRFMIAYAVFALVLSGISINEYLKSMNATNFWFVRVLGANYLSLGLNVSVGILTVLSFFLYEQGERRVKFLALGMLMALLFTLFISGGRMPVISLVVVAALIPFGYVKLKQGRILIKKGFGRVVWVYGMSISAMLYLAASGYFNTFFVRIMTLFQEQGGGDSAHGRTERLEAALRMVNFNPFGQGIGSFPIHYTGSDIRDFPHNIFIEALSELGVVGVILLGILFFIPMLRWFRLDYSDLKYYHYAIFYTFLYMFINANVSGDFNDNRQLFAFAALTSVIPYLVSKHKNDELKEPEKVSHAKNIHPRPANVLRNEL